MFSMLYFPMVSALSLLGADAPTHLHSHLKLILGGEFNAALERSSEWAETTVASERTSWDLQLHADLQLVLGFEVEAEENYRRAQRKIRGSNSKIRIATCRNAAWQALFRYRVTTALACFSRICDEPGIEAGGLVEARFGIACALYEMGRIDDAFDAIDSMEKIAEQQSDEMRAHWKDLIAVLRFDLVVQSELRRAAAFVDHVYWQSAQSMSRVDRAHGVSEAAVSVETPLLRGRVAYLLQLRCAAAGNRDAVAELARLPRCGGRAGIRRLSIHAAPRDCARPARGRRAQFGAIRVGADFRHIAWRRVEPPLSGIFLLRREGASGAGPHAGIAGLIPTLRADRDEMSARGRADRQAVPGRAGTEAASPVRRCDRALAVEISARLSLYSPESQP